MGPYDVRVPVSCGVGFFWQSSPRTNSGSKSTHQLGGGFEATVCPHGLCERLLARFRRSIPGIGKRTLLDFLRDSFQKRSRKELSRSGSEVFFFFFLNERAPTYIHPLPLPGLFPL